jgi:hypothetical protein
MKLKYLLLMVVFVSCTTTRNITLKDSKGKIEFKSIEKFNGDTIAYNVYNFIDRKDLFIGKPASLILNNINYEIKSYIPAINLDDIVFGIYVYPYSENERRGKDFRDIKTVNLIIGFSPGVPYRSFLSVFPKGRMENFNWSPALKEFFGKLTVSDVTQLDSTDKK